MNEVSNYLLTHDLCGMSYLAEFPDKMCPYCYPPKSWEEVTLNLKEQYIYNKVLRRWMPKDLPP